jgi:monoamine oxidase
VERQPDVIVIGAGVAGLAASRALTQAGASVAIIEARERLGGRIWTLSDSLSSAPVELGAEFVHGRPSEVCSLAGSGAIAVSQAEGSRVDAGTAGAARDQDSFDRIGGVLDKLGGEPDQPFRKFIDAAGVPPDLKRRTVRYVEGFNAASQDLIGTGGLAQQTEAAKRIGGGYKLFRVDGGYGALVRAFADALNRSLARFYLGSVVEEVTWRRGYVEVRAARSGGTTVTLRAPRAIVTLPLGVLQANAVAFNPEPENLRDACRALVMGHAARITFCFHTAVWEKRPEFENLAMLHSGEDWMPTWWTPLPVRAPVITGWTGGPAAGQRGGDDVSAWVPGALRTLARLLRTDVASLSAELESWHAHNWDADPFARGAYSYVRPGGLEAQRRFGDPVEDTLYFAGEAVNAEGHCATVHGAIASGDRAARLIVDRR